MTAIPRAKPSRLSISDDSFNTFFWVSAIIHVSLFFGLTIKQVFMPSEVIVIQNAMRVDMVALPDKAEPEAGPSPAAPKPVELPPAEAEKSNAAPPTPEKKISLEKKKPDAKQKQLEALNKLKQRDALERLASTKKPAETATPAQPKKTLNAGNQLSQGDSVTGLERISFDAYIGQIKGTVRENFSLPTWLQDQKLKCAVEVTIEASGRVLGRTLSRTSGNAAFDNAALSAVDASSPFPAVPERLTQSWGRFIIQFNFPDT